MTDSAPSFFMVEIANNSSIMPSLIFLGSNDLIMNTLWPLIESKIWILTSPSLNFPHIWRPRPISRWLAISLASISASKAKSFKLENSDCKEVRKILLMVVSISEVVSYSSLISERTLQLVARGAINPPMILRKVWRISHSNKSIQTYPLTYIIT